MKKKTVIIAVLLLIPIIFVIYIFSGLNMKNKGEPFDKKKVEGYMNWKVKEDKVNVEDLEKYGKPDLKDKILADYVKDDIYFYPRIPNSDGFEYENIGKITADSIVNTKLDLVPADKLPKLDFSNIGVEEGSVNRVFNFKDGVMALNLGNRLYRFTLGTEDCSIIKEFGSSDDYTRRFRYLWIDGENIYYVLNKFNGKEFEDDSDNILHIENYKTGESRETDLNNLKTLNYSDFIHYVYAADGNYIFNNEDGTLYAYNILNGENKKLFKKDGYYFAESDKNLLTDRYYIEYGIYENRYGVRIFSLEDGKVENTIVDNDRYGNIGNIKHNENYLICYRTLFRTGDKDNYFYVINLDSQKVRKITVKSSENLFINPVGIYKDVLYLESENSEGGINFYKYDLKN